MADLRAISACEGLLPVLVGQVSLTAVEAGNITSLMPYMGQEKQASEVLKQAHGCRFPAPGRATGRAIGRATGRAGCRALWSGQGQALLLGPVPARALAKTCAMTDQSDAWAVMQLAGAEARAVLARLCPLDLRPQIFKRGHTARSLLGRMNVSITRTGADTYLLMLARSMVASAVREISGSMKSVMAQQP